MSTELRSGGRVCRLEGRGTGTRLALGTDAAAIVSFPLSELFAFSSGKPWALAGAELADVEAAREGALLRIRAPRVFRGIEVEASFTFRGTLLEAALRWTNGGPVVPDAVVGLSFPFPVGDEAKLTLPHQIYNDNPSADPATMIPRVGRVPGRGFVCEEHRLPIPGANVQWAAAGAFPHLSVLAEPSLIDAEDIDSCWSAGFLKTANGFSALFLSGATMFDGVCDVVYGGQCSPLAYERGYFDFGAGTVVEKRFVLSWGAEYPNGHGFRDLVCAGWEALDPKTEPALSARELIDLKYNCLDSRRHEDASSAGYACFGAANAFGNISKRPEYYLYAWTGEALKLAWCDAFRALSRGDEAGLARASETVDFFVRESVRGPTVLPSAYCLYEEGRWGGAWFDNDAELSSRMVGCSAADLLDYCVLLKERGKQVPAAWEEFARRICAALAEPELLTSDGVFPLKWKATGGISGDFFTSAGIPCVIALAKAGAYFSDAALLSRAEEVLERYYDKTARDMRYPFAYATLDAKCEDKEAGMYFFAAALELHKRTGSSRYLDWAAVAADWVLTFQYLWEPPVRPESVCAKHGFRICGWPGVSPQNHHLDVFFPAAELIEFGGLSGESRYARAGRLALEAWTHGVCVRPGDYGFTVPGEQGEQYHHTNYVQCRHPEVQGRRNEWRGGMQPWNPSWIIAEVLQAALRIYGAASLPI